MKVFERQSRQVNRAPFSNLMLGEILRADFLSVLSLDTTEVNLCLFYKSEDGM